MFVEDLLLRIAKVFATGMLCAIVLVSAVEMLRKTVLDFAKVHLCLIAQESVGVMPRWIVQESVEGPRSQTVTECVEVLRFLIVLVFVAAPLLVIVQAFVKGTPSAIAWECATEPLDSIATAFVTALHCTCRISYVTNLQQQTRCKWCMRR